MSMRCAGIDTGGFSTDEAVKAGYVDTISQHTDIIEGLNISGATVDAAINFLSDGIPFTTKLPGGRYVLVVSYNANYIRYYDPVLGQEVRTARDSFTEDVRDAGQEIYVYRFLK